MPVEKHVATSNFVVFFDRDRSVQVARDFLQSNRILLDQGLPEDFDPKTFWSPTRPRSEGRRSNAWFFLRDWNSAYEGLRPEERLELVSRFKNAFPEWKYVNSDMRSMAFHDETAAQRAINACIFLHVFNDEIEEVGFPELRRSLAHDLELLESDDFYAGLNNHGMFQDTALLVAHDYGMVSDEAEQKAIDRLTRYFDFCFTADGIHKENNPTYHLMAANYVKLVSNYLTETGRTKSSAHLSKVLEKADLYSAACLLPNGEFPPISDTKTGRVDIRVARRYFGENYLVGAISQGKHGKLPADLNYIAGASGYAIFRTGWTADSSFAMFSAAYNADYHKHSDELSVYVYANEHAILAEAGPNGYQYSDPLTSYAFSSFAHNTLIVDNQGLRRVDDNAHLTTLKKVSDTVAVGNTRRYEGVDWSRTVDATDWQSAGLLKISDHIESNETHNYKILWHLGPDVTPVVRGNYVEVFSNGSKKKIAELNMKGSATTAVEHRRGQMKPRVQGFAFPSMGKNVPASVIEFEFATSLVAVEWELRTQDFLLQDRGITPFSSVWKTYFGEKPVRYLLDKQKSGADRRLLFVFSAVNPLNDFTYNYRASLADFPGVVCYILDDFGDQGSYYLANHRNFAEFRSVQAAMAEIMKEVGVEAKDCYALGSSKGGSGAIIHGVSAGVQHVLVGGPQYKIGLFTHKPHPNILKYISGGNTEDDITWADNAMRSVLEDGDRSTDISLVVGKADGHYRHHALPFANDARELGYTVRMLTLPGTKHSELGKAFRQIVGSFSKSFTRPRTMLTHAIAADNDAKKIGICIDCPEDTVILAQLQKDGKPVDRPIRVRNGVAEWEAKEPGVYRARIYFDRAEEEDRFAFGSIGVRITK